jgi:dolichol-phosphate mannosyltransferase
LSPQRSLIVIPTYNEAENIGSLVEQVFLRVPNVNVLVVDDGSPDGTGTLVSEIARKNDRVHLLSRSGKQGLGTAYVAGFKWGLEKGFDTLIEMDADFSHDPKYLPDMLHHLASNDFAIGSRYVAGGGTVNWGLGRKILSRGGSFYARTILGMPIRDFTGGFNGWHRRVLEAVDLGSLRSDGYSFQIELKHRAALLGFRFTEFPIVFVDRTVGKSKMNKRIVIEALSRVWLFRWRAHDFKLRSQSWLEAQKAQKS